MFQTVCLKENITEDKWSNDRGNELLSLQRLQLHVIPSSQQQISGISRDNQVNDNLSFLYNRIYQKTPDTRKVPSELIIV